jgi:methionyl-tRNA synthetase
MDWDSAIDWNVEMAWNLDKPEPLFQRLDLEEILSSEQSLVDDKLAKDQPGHGVKGSKKKNKGDKKMSEAPEGIEYVDFETFMKVDLRVGKISSVEEHPNADKLYVVKLDDGTDE